MNIIQEHGVIVLDQSPPLSSATVKPKTAFSMSILTPADVKFLWYCQYRNGI